MIEIEKDRRIGGREVVETEGIPQRGIERSRRGRDLGKEREQLRNSELSKNFKRKNVRYESRSIWVQCMKKPRLKILCYCPFEILKIIFSQKFSNIFWIQHFKVVDSAKAL